MMVGIVMTLFMFWEERLFPAFAEKHAIVRSTQVATEPDELVWVNGTKLFYGTDPKCRHDSRKDHTRGVNIGGMGINDRTLNDSTVEQWVRLVVRREKVTDDITRSGGFTKDGHVGWVTAKVADKMVNPLKCADLITKTIIADAIVPRKFVIVANDCAGGKSE
jgi:hypothetical protein